MMNSHMPDCQEGGVKTELFQVGSLNSTAGKNSLVVARTCVETGRFHMFKSSRVF